VTATAATNGQQRRSTAAQNALTIRANSGYVRPEKQTVADQCSPAAAAANTAAMTADNTCQASTTVEYRSSAQTV
jgi:hypothetical protein